MDWLSKAAMLAGFGAGNVRVVASDSTFALRVDLLEAAIQADLAAGRQPCAVVASVGTTTTALDPVEKISALTQQYGLWLHVDAAMAGSAMLLPECRWMWEGVENADSLVVNAHKWLGAVFDTSIYYVRDPQHLIRVMSTNPSYLQSAADNQVKNLRDWGIPLGRRFRALKLWALIRTQGREGLQAGCDEVKEQIATLEALIERAQDGSSARQKGLYQRAEDEAQAATVHLDVADAAKAGGEVHSLSATGEETIMQITEVNGASPETQIDALERMSEKAQEQADIIRNQQEPL
ncbi:pyridoxal phosphate-dependent decarboxylase family protein [Deinococcus alpinitundrae]|uniref:pyridoxal phosphate-dependent decarboxylase family protein n=1 Tax=Deinococcus alpinitundrae TaxID=468913 RepID=UPI00235759EE|nr:pyridoxal-dependent decarboxylase [Deinococcus alpinitundrae]